MKKPTKASIKVARRNRIKVFITKMVKKDTTYAKVAKYAGSHPRAVAQILKSLSKEAGMKKFTIKVHKSILAH